MLPFQSRHLWILSAAASAATGTLALGTLAGWWQTPAAPVAALAGVATALGVGGSLKSAKKQSAAAGSGLIPAHFQTAWDGLSEAALLIDRQGLVSVANQTFCELVGQKRAALVGRKVLEFGWKWIEVDALQQELSEVTWLTALRDGKVKQGRFSNLGVNSEKIFAVNVIAITDEAGLSHGALVSLENVTRQGKKKAELLGLMETLRESSERIRQQNHQLEELATRDALTGTHNRRSGFEFLQRFWAEAKRYRDHLSCVMVDVDRFRDINDAQGNEAADHVLKQVAVCLQQAARECDIVCRYGGEEFVILMPRTMLDDAALVAERLRHAVQRLKFPEFQVTVSLGVSSTEQGPKTPQDLLQQTERALEQAKKAGRNQTVRHDAIAAVVPQETAPSPRAALEQNCVIPFPAVTALISALAYRDVATAAHSRRVADHCVAIGQRMMSMSSCYVLETAALLHDIGKIGVPDSILLKPTELTESEWNSMRAHDRIGLEIIRTSFGAPELSAIVDQYTRKFSDASAENPIPLGARILAIADAYDAMVTDKPYRHGASPAEAISELRRCAGTQFDPEIVEQFIEQVLTRGREMAVKLDVARETALALGMELERLADAVDQQDLNLLKALAGRLSLTAARSGATEIAGKALELENAATAGTDLLGILRCADELLNYCRATQGMYVDEEHVQPNVRGIAMLATLAS